MMELQTARTRVTLLSADPLARRGLVAALRAHDVEVSSEVSSDLGSSAAGEPHVDAVVWDDGPSGGGPLPERHPTPLLALVADSDRARVMLREGARGALLRDGDGQRMAAAIAAIEAGLIVVDDTFVRDLTDRGEAAGDELGWIEPLTGRELEVIGLIAEGLSNKEIAATLGISPHTAKFHVNTILGKLDAQTRTEAVVRAARAGLLQL